MKYSLWLVINLAILSTIMISCQKDVVFNPAINNYLKVADVVSSNSSFKVEMYANDSLFVGYNKLYFKVINNSTGQPINEATVSLHPLMNMGTMMHACPFENPGSTSDATGYFEGAVIFSMAGNNAWSLGVDVTALGKSETANFALPKVTSTNPVSKIVAIDSLSNGSGGWIITKYPLSLIMPKSWKVGNNTFEITAHRMVDMMNFPPATDLTFEITPEMPSMGHGSPNNVNPAHTANGHYAGNVNFTMTGDWRINMVIKQGGRVITNKLYFDITF